MRMIISLLSGNVPPSSQTNKMSYKKMKEALLNFCLKKNKEKKVKMNKILKLKNLLEDIDI